MHFSLIIFVVLTSKMFETMLMLFFWVVMPSGLVGRYHHFSPEDGDSMFLQIDAVLGCDAMWTCR
jgi:hypothetical protein